LNHNPRLGDVTTKAPKQKLGSLHDEVERIKLQLSSLPRAGQPVIAGPFTGEVGFELLYWIPFLRWAVRAVPELGENLIIVSRGGVQTWVEGLGARYIDILSLCEPEEFAAHRALADKQRDIKQFDRWVIERVERELGIEQATILHPSMMYEAYFRFMKLSQLGYVRALERRDDGIVEGLTSLYAPIARPDRSALPRELPEDYVAVRFYSRDSFAQSEESAAFASAVIEALSRTTNVVLIGTRIALDEHRDVQGRLPDSVITIDHLLRPHDNLAAQTAVVANSRAFVGTYGGFSYLAPFLNVPSISFSTNRNATQSWHFELAQGIFNAPGWGGFVALRHTDLPLIDLITRGFARAEGEISWAGGTGLELSGGLRAGTNP
jgi:hypothetical protein